MPRSTVIILCMLIAAGGALLIGADMLLGTLKKDVGLGQDLTRLLAAREEIAADSRVKAIRRPASEKTLATEGRGVVVTLVPAEAVRRRTGGLDALIRLVVTETADHFRGPGLDWIEFRLLRGAADPGDTPEATFRTLVTRVGAHEFGLPQPPPP